jgi:hypothetical protein
LVPIVGQPLDVVGRVGFLGRPLGGLGEVEQTVEADGRPEERREVKVRIAKSSKEQDGYEAPDMTGARLYSEAPEGTPEATSKVAPNELAKPVWFQGSVGKFLHPVRTGIDGKSKEVRAIERGPPCRTGTRQAAADR